MRSLDDLAGIAEKENVKTETEALALIARAAEGSVRDSLSLFDQAIAHADLDSGGKVTAERVRDMLGMADKSAMRRLFASRRALALFARLLQSSKLFVPV